MTESLMVGKLTDNFALNKSIFWEIPNFLKLKQCVDSSVHSPSFTFAHASWCLRLYPNGRTDRKSEGYLGVVIVRLDSCVPDHEVFYNLAILEPYSGEYETCSSAANFNEECLEEGNFFLLRPSQMIRLRLKYAEKCTVKLLCEMRMNIETGVHVFCQTESPEPPRNLETLSHNFKNLFLNGQDHDLTLQVKDKEFRAHQCVLRARSQVFESMLSHDMVEKNSGVINVPDCDTRAFEQFLLYLYTGKVENLDENNMLGLYYIADKYNMADLREECSEFVKKSLSSRVVCDVIQLALNHSDSGLLDCATDYFVQNIGDILPTVEWQSFMKANPTQANELLIKTAKKWNDKKT